MTLGIYECEICNGVGKINFTPTDDGRWSFCYCPKCDGEGSIDWVKNILSYRSPYEQTIGGFTTIKPPSNATEYKMEDKKREIRYYKKTELMIMLNSWKIVDTASDMDDDGNVWKHVYIKDPVKKKIFCVEFLNNEILCSEKERKKDKIQLVEVFPKKKVVTVYV